MLHGMKSWWNYQRNAQGKYYLHSPFVYQFYTQILEPAPDEKCLVIDKELFKLKQNHSPFRQTSVSQLVKQELDLKYGKAIYQLLKQSKAQYVLASDSSPFGIDTAYLAASKQDILVTTVNESHEYAKMIHRNLGLKNVDYSSFLTDKVLQDFPRLDTLLVNAADKLSIEKFLPLVHSETIFIIRNIHETEASETLWSKIKAYEKVTTTIDLYKLGLAFFRRENLAKADFILRY